MKIYDQTKTIVLENPDLKKGKLVPDVLTVHHDAVESVKEQSHYEVVREYANGGKDIKKIIDVEGVAGSPAYDDVKNIEVYIPYTEKELRDNEIADEIAILKGKLFDTDYKILKYTEGELPEDEYLECKAQRRSWREQINELEEELKGE